MGKAIQVLKDNKSRLITQYDLDEDALDGLEGLWLIADFGEAPIIHGFINGNGLFDLYNVSEKKLDNDYVEIKRK